IVFTSNRDGKSQIYVMNADGSNPTRLTRNTAIDAAPAWSPDGTKIAFVSNRDGELKVYIMNADGSEQRRLTAARRGAEGVGAWDEDGVRVNAGGGAESLHHGRGGERAAEAHGGPPWRRRNARLVTGRPEDRVRFGPGRLVRHLRGQRLG